MAVNFDRATELGRAIAEIVMAPIVDAGITPVVVDVGARNGIYDVPESYTRYAAFVGFEPNPAEYEKLVADNTDSMKAGYIGPRFKSKHYHPYALWSADETRTFYITAGPGACTLMGEGRREITDRMYRDTPKDQGGSYAYIPTVERTIPMECRRMDNLVTGTIDYLKLDVEGAEVEVFKGAQKLFDRKAILFIKSEFLITPYHQATPLLGHQHALLHDAGFRLLDTDQHHARYARGKTAIPPTSDRRLIYAGDAYFALDPDRNALAPMDLQRMAAASFAFGFNSFGVGLMRDAALLPAAEIDAVERAVAYVKPLTRMKDAWIAFPDKVVAFLQRTGIR
jgi:FkbM family methyltransferase